MKRNVRNVADGARLFAEMRDEEANLVFIDPQYRTGLDKLGFGNEGARQKGRAKLAQMTDETISTFLFEAERVLKPSGHVMLWIDKFLSVTGHWRSWLPLGVRGVDQITWNKGRPGMGYRSRCSSEFLVILQKGPVRSAGCWTDKGIPDVWLEYADPTHHPHAKPLQLTQRLIRATTRRDDLVVDPCAGGFGVLDCCLATRRQFLGCDLAELPQ